MPAADPASWWGTARALPLRRAAAHARRAGPDLRQHADLARDVPGAVVPRARRRTPSGPRPSRRASATSPTRSPTGSAVRSSRAATAGRRPGRRADGARRPGLGPDPLPDAVVGRAGARRAAASAAPVPRVAPGDRRPGADRHRGAARRAGRPARRHAGPALRLRRPARARRRGPGRRRRPQDRQVPARPATRSPPTRSSGSTSSPSSTARVELAPDAEHGGAELWQLRKEVRARLKVQRQEPQQPDEDGVRPIERQLMDRGRADCATRSSRPGPATTASTATSSCCARPRLRHGAVVSPGRASSAG